MVENNDHIDLPNGHLGANTDVYIALVPRARLQPRRRRRVRTVRSPIVRFG